MSPRSARSAGNSRNKPPLAAEGVNDVQLLPGGTVYFAALVAAIEGAQVSVALETYIFDFFGVGTKVATALMHAAQRGVAVRVMVDGVGTPYIPPAWRQAWQQAGVDLVQYAPLGRLGLLIPSRWRRLHRKLCVIDGTSAFCGGINVLDDWFDPNHGDLQAPRFDFALQVQGPMVQGIARAMDVLWRRTKAVGSVRGMRDKTLEGARDALIVLAKTATAMGDRQHTMFPGPQGGSFHWVLRDNVHNRRSIERAYLSAIAGARQDITLANAYFLPGKTLRTALARAVKRGVRVRILLQGRYEYFMQFHAARAVYGALLQAGVEIYEYEPSFLHAKVGVVDAGTAHSWMTVGSSNLDPLSLLLAREANVVALGSPLSQQLLAHLETAMDQHSQRVAFQQFVNRPWHERARNWAAYALMRAALFVAGKRY